MTRTAQYLDRFFWLLTTGVFLGAALSLLAVGCETLQRTGEALATPSETLGGQTPAEAIVDGAVGVTINPLSWPAWGKLGGGLFVVIAALWGRNKLAKRNA